MAILENGLESIELGATAWREILNYNFAKLLTKEQILALIQQGGANADGSVPSYLTKQEASSLYALKSELGNADLSQYLTLAAADGKYLSKLEANSFLTQQSADNYYAKKTELSGFATKDELSEINTGDKLIDDKIQALNTKIDETYAKKTDVVIQSPDGAINLSAYALKSQLDELSSKLKGWAPISGSDLTNISNNGDCFVNEKGFLTFADVEGDQAFLFSQDIRKIRVYYDSTRVNAAISIIYRENGDSVSLYTYAYSGGYKKALNSTSYSSFLWWFGSYPQGCFYEIEMLEDNILLIHSYNGKSAFKVDDTLHLGLCVNLKGNNDYTAGKLRVQKWA
ncbi:MAG: hypothetical protein MSA79_02210 [Campylobacter sp.]|nr:hypothetical protein [Campylobacter sp.]